MWMYFKRYWQQQLNEVVHRAGQTTKRYAGQIALGVGLLSVAIWLGGVTLLTLLVALFFSLSSLATLTEPALWTALTAAAAGLILGSAGLSVLRRR